MVEKNDAIVFGVACEVAPDQLPQLENKVKPYAVSKASKAK
ncbi:hypothetical protein VCHA31O73_360060 [Vibrio chagasii]|nr:hypothetical protein VCHA31O73_360060 [Vibrio chagasii]